MDDLAVGRVIRAVRRRRGLRQVDLATLSGVSQQSVSQLERGRLEAVSLGSARRIARSVQVELRIEPRWRGPNLARLLDERHAALVDRVVRSLAASGFEVAVEYSFNHFGERGAVDVLGWAPQSRALAIVEVKTRIVDIQDLIATLDRKRRLIPPLVAADRGWRAGPIGTLVVLPESSTTRDAVARHAATFDAAFPGRSRAVRRWLHEPDGEVRGLLFVRDTSAGGLARGAGERTRVGRPRRTRIHSSVPDTTTKAGGPA
jgi:transcriptional regulator with XRE-family HTH domain